MAIFRKSLPLTATLQKLFILLAFVGIIPIAGFAQPKGYWRLVNAPMPGNGFPSIILDSTFLMFIDYPTRFFR